MARVTTVDCPEYERAWAMLTPLAARGFTLTLDIYTGQGPASSDDRTRSCRCIARSPTHLGLRTEYESYNGPESWSKVVAKVIAVFPAGRAVAT